MQIFFPLLWGSNSCILYMTEKNTLCSFLRITNINQLTGNIMTTSSILESTSYGALNANAQAAVRRLFEQLERGEKLDFAMKDVFHKRNELRGSIDIYESRVNRLNPAIFPYLSDAKRKALEQDLNFAFYLFSAQFFLDEAEHRRQNHASHYARIKLCADLLFKLRAAKEKKNPETILQEAADGDKLLKYLGLTHIAPVIVAQVDDLLNTKNPKAQWEATLKENLEDLSNAGTKDTKDAMRAVNERRLYWVWGGTFLWTVLDLLPANFASKLQTEEVLTKISPITGYMSWLLYYTRFGIELGLLLKHTIKGPWMSDEEQKMSVNELFKTQWEQRKFALLNDSIWATVNLVTFFWLTGKGMAGYAGNVLTAGLLLVDAALVSWSFYEESTRHNANILRYQRDVVAIEKKLKNEAFTNEHAALQEQLNQLKADKKACEFNWKYEKIKLATGLTYSVALLAAFIVFAAFLFPPTAIAASTALIFAIVGAALCFSLNVISAAITSSCDIAKAWELSKPPTDKEFADIMQKFKEGDEDCKKLIYLELKERRAETEYQARVVRYQTLQLIRAIFIDALIPPLVFVSFTFLPLGGGIAVLALGLALAIASQLILKQFQPKEAELPEFNQEEYEVFAQHKTWDSLQTREKPSYSAKFFDGRKKNDEEEPPLPNDLGYQQN